jgi:flagellar assembly protein FliH
MNGSRSALLEYARLLIGDDEEGLMPERFARVDWVQHDVPVQSVQHHLSELEPPPPIQEEEPEEVPSIDAAAIEAEIAMRVAEAETRAQSAIDAAIAEANRWRAEMLAHETDGFNEGFTRGYEEGQLQGKQDGEASVQAAMQPLIDSLTAMVQQAIVEPRQAILDAQDGLARLSIAVARALIGSAFDMEPSLLARRLTSLLERLSDVTTAVVRLHPADLALVQPVWLAQATAYGWSESAPRLLGDDTLTRGSCVIESRTHYLDARLETLLGEVSQLFTTVSAEQDTNEQQNVDEQIPRQAAA